MAMALPVRVTEICKITPPPESATESSLPLTFFDTYWIKFHPVERIFFYELAVDSSSFFATILPSLKHSLSLTLLHFLPFAGHLVWPSFSDKPFISYTPGDGVFLSVADSDEDFYSVSGDSIREVPISHRYLPQLEVTETKASMMSFQITLFPNKGFSIGISSHHAAFDGKSITLLLKCWAFICKHGGSLTLPAELTPVFDRTVIQDPQGLDMVFVNLRIAAASKSGMYTNPRSLELSTMYRSTTDANFVRVTFKLSGDDINKIRAKALSFQLGTNGNNMKHYSTFVLTYAYVSIAIVKALGLERNTDSKLVLVYPADLRARLDPSVDRNYCGNCVIPVFMPIKVESLIKEDGLTFLVEELTQSVRGLDKGGLDRMDSYIDILKEILDLKPVQLIGVAGSPRFGVYGIDFGFGKPNKVELTSIDRGTTISMSERGDGKDGVEVGVVLKKDEIKMFESFLVDGLKDLYI